MFINIYSHSSTYTHTFIDLHTHTHPIWLIIITSTIQVLVSVNIRLYNNIMYFIDDDDLENVLGRGASRAIRLQFQQEDKVETSDDHEESDDPEESDSGWMKLEISPATLTNILVRLGKRNLVSRCFIFYYFRCYRFTN